MARKTAKTAKTKGENNEAENFEVNSTSDSALDDAFDKFENNDAEFTPTQQDEQPDQQQEQEQQQEQKPVSNLTPEEQKFQNDMKARFFVGFFTYLLAGANTFLLNMMSGTEVPLEKMLMTDPEKLSIEGYVKSPEIMAWLNKLPTWLIATMHIEYIFIRKFQAVKNEHKKPKKLKAVKD